MRTERDLLEAIGRGTAARVFGTASASLALLDETTDELVYAAAWGVGAVDIVGVRLGFGQGIAGAVVQSGDPSAVTELPLRPALRRADRRRDRLRTAFDARRPAQAR